MAHLAFPAFVTLQLYCARSSTGLEHRSSKSIVAGSNPAERTNFVVFV